MHYLCWATDGRVLACTTDDHLFTRVGESDVWAYETANCLYSARTGRAIAYRIGNTYYDADRHTPLYREDLGAASDSTTRTLGWHAGALYETAKR